MIPLRTAFFTSKTFRTSRIILVACTVLFTHPIHAQWIGDPQAEAHLRKGIDFVYNLSFDSARTEFKQVIHAHPDHPAGLFFLATVEWWSILIDIDNTSHDETFFSMLDRVVDLCDKRLENDENDISALFFKGGALGFQGRLHGNRGDWIKAANAGREALPVVQQAYALAPQNYDILLGIGIYNYYASVVPDMYPMVKPLMVFFPRGDKVKGIDQLRQASEKAPYANVEASYFLMQLFQNYERRYPEALALARTLHRRYPNNVMFHKYVGRCAASLSEMTEVRTTFSEILQRVNERRLGYNEGVEREARYYLGIDAMNMHNYDTALQYFYRCDDLSRTLDKEESTGFMVMTNLKIGMIYDVQSKRDDAIRQYKKVLKMADYQDAHEQAKRYLKSSYTRQ